MSPVTVTFTDEEVRAVRVTAVRILNLLSEMRAEHLRIENPVHPSVRENIERLGRTVQKAVASIDAGTVSEGEFKMLLAALVALGPYGAGLVADIDLKNYHRASAANAGAGHKGNSEARKKILAAWERDGHGYDSVSEFAEEQALLDGTVEPRTIRSWLKGRKGR